ncbi:hypothetical protein BDV41DRAFT_531457 [Aspergillus transmontanensis]|uniref:Uncharacterized protein n=1 Tax=Aspergillus transmontanensis TaxID=1034304 RepID=A0A5N6W330_9EURO|nr:hypothetical protein BDV41DRAFT_531457 [Aspergillus transmontanensis]
MRGRSLARYLCSWLSLYVGRFIVSLLAGRSRNIYQRATSLNGEILCKRFCIVELVVEEGRKMVSITYCMSVSEL